MNKNIISIALIILVGFGLFKMLSSDTTGSDNQLSGTIKIDGSSTVFPISVAVAEEFMATQPQINVIVNSSGTGGGFKKFYNSETQINNASRPIKSKEEKEIQKNKLSYIELPVAYDGLARFPQEAACQTCRKAC